MLSCEWRMDQMFSQMDHLLNCLSFKRWSILHHSYHGIRTHFMENGNYHIGGDRNNLIFALEDWDSGVHSFFINQAHQRHLLVDKLLNYITGSPKPTHFLSESECTEWEQQNQLLLSRLLSSMSESLLMRMIGCDESSKIRSKLKQYFTVHTKARIK